MVRKAAGSLPWICAAAVFLTLAWPAGTLQADAPLEQDGTEFLDDGQKAFLEELLDRLENGELSSEEQIDEAVRKAQEELGITFTEEQKEQITGWVLQADRLDLGREEILDGARALYEKYGSAILESADEAVRENIVEPVKEAAVKEVKKTFREFFHEMGETMKGFVIGLFG